MKGEVINFYFVRHCKTNWNNKKLCQGTTDIPLSTDGRKEAENLAESLREISFDTIFVSDMKRAEETALLIQKKSKRNVRRFVLPELKERYFGSLEGLPSDLMYTFEEIENRGILENIAYEQLGIETPEQIQKRVKSALDKIIKESKHQVVLVVSHGRFFNELCKVMNTRLVQQLQHNSVIRFTLYQDNSWLWEEHEK